MVSQSTEPLKTNHGQSNEAALDSYGQLYALKQQVEALAVATDENAVQVLHYVSSKTAHVREQLEIRLLGEFSQILKLMKWPSTELHLSGKLQEDFTRVK